MYLPMDILIFFFHDFTRSSRFGQNVKKKRVPWLMFTNLRENGIIATIFRYGGKINALVCKARGDRVECRK